MDAAAQLSFLPAASPRDKLDDPEWLREHATLHSAQRIARTLGCSTSTVCDRMRRHGIPVTANRGPVVQVDFTDHVFMARVKERMSLDLARGEVGPSVLAARVRAAALADRAGDVEARDAALAEVAASSMIWAGAV